jgi:UDP-3-O-[3-hydroxymyristoyl] glucosamine N-acyltransferase
VQTSWTLGQIAVLAGGQLQGDPGIVIRGIAPLQTARPGDLTWVTSAHFAKLLAHSEASAALIGPDLSAGDLPVVVCPHPDRSLARVLSAMEPPVPHPPPGVDPRAIVPEDVTLGEDVAIGPLAVIGSRVRIGARTRIHAGVFIGPEVEIGPDCVIWPQAVIRERCVLGARVVLHPHATIGADGFGYNFIDGHYERIPQIGRVRIEDDVEVGANSCIDRAKCGETVIGRGSKIDNLVQIGHNCKLGPHTCLAAQVGIAGSATLGSHALFGGKVGVRDNLVIGDRVQVAACTCLAEDVPDDSVRIGVPGIDKMQFLRELGALRRLPETTRLVRILLKRVEQLEAADHKTTR